ncbi:MAG: hypothetical protein U9R25_00195 [Chloroflexota bacterium]|nr:hypothetical protein [Chloroflexota bacterium]
MNHKSITLIVFALIAMLTLGACQSEPDAEPDITESIDLIGDNPPVKVLTQRPVNEVVGEKDVLLPALSPDGSAIAWVKSTGKRQKTRVTEVCIYTFADARNACSQKPDAYSSYPAQLVWSPDSAHIAFSENPLQLGDESDIWMFSVADGSFVNLTDDGLEGFWRDPEAGSYFLDYLPMWNQEDGLIYFWRSLPVSFQEVTLQLMRISPEGGEPELVADVSDELMGQLIWWDYEFFYMDGPWAVSPDGSRAALLVGAMDTLSGSPLNGLWTIDLADPSGGPQQVLTTDQMQVALPPWQEVPARPIALSWSADSSQVVVLAQSQDLKNQINLFYVVEVPDGTAIPVYDFSGVTTREGMFATSQPMELPPLYYSAWTAGLSPAGDKLLMYTDFAAASGILSASLADAGDLPAVVYASDDTTSYVVTRTSRSSDGKVILNGSLYTVEE